MSNSIFSFFDMLARAFEENSMLTVAQNFGFPMPLYAHGGLVVFGAPATIAEALSQYRQLAWAHGVRRVVPRIIAEGLWIKRTTNLWVEWDHIDANGDVKRTSQVCYVLHKPANAMTPRIGMVDYTVPAFPEMAAQLPLAQRA